MTHPKARLGWTGLFFKTGSVDVNIQDPAGEIPFYTCGKKILSVTEGAFNGEALLVAGNGDVGTVIYHKGGPFQAYQRTYVIQGFSRWDTRYLAYQLEGNFKQKMKEKSIGSVLQFITIGDIKGFEVFIPPIPTQTAIADYLDRKTAAIDTLIAKKEELIRELDAYRQALITETVSKGLNPDVAVRQSGVAGLGEIPAHWQVVKTGKVLRYIKGKAVPKEDLALEGGASQRFWRTGDFWNLNNREKDEVFVTNSTGLVWKNEDELVICFDGFNSEIGKGTVGMARFEGEGYIDSHLELVTPRSTQVHKRFLEYVHCTSWMESAIVRWARGAIAYSAGYAKYELQLPLPPLPEQEAIAAHLDARLAGFRRTREIASKQIAMLKEYRASLISEAVTGKLAIK